MLTPRYGYGAVVRYSRLLYESRFRRSSRLFYGSKFGRSSRLFYGQGLGGASFEPVEDDSPVEEVSPAEAKKVTKGVKKPRQLTSETTSHDTLYSVHGGLNLNEEADTFEEEVQEVEPI
ncbi:hypothetical protein Tco_1051965 [Tanacetum coccineum]